MKGSMAFVTFNPGGVIQIKINRFSPREVLLFQVKRGQGHHAADNASPVKVNFFHCLYPGVISIVSHYTLKCWKYRNRSISTNQYKCWGHYGQLDDNTNYLEKKNSQIHRETGKKRSCHLKTRLDLPPEMAKCTARSVKMTNNASHNSRRKPCCFGTA